MALGRTARAAVRHDTEGQPREPESPDDRPYRIRPRRCSCLFFFQAEDGIRDTSVTGVQTCALPILTHASHLPSIGSQLARTRPIFSPSGCDPAKCIC